MSPRLSLLRGMAVGAVLMYFLDPDLGRRRRARLRDRALVALSWVDDWGKRTGSPAAARRPARRRRPAPVIALYTKPGSEPCRQARDYFEGLGLSYQEHDVSQDVAARAELEGMVGAGVPVIVIDGQAVLGFDRDRLDDLLKAMGVAAVR